MDTGIVLILSTHIELKKYESGLSNAMRWILFLWQSWDTEEEEIEQRQ